MILSSFETSNMALAAALQCYGVFLDSIRRTDKRGIFCFIDVPQDMLKKFDEGKLVVDPTMFMVYVRRLTSIVKQTING